MNNYISRGETCTLTAPYDVSSGGGALVGSVFGVACGDVANTQVGEFRIKGVIDLAKDASTFAEGALVYWDNTAKDATSTALNNTKIGVAVPTQPDGSAAPGSQIGDATVRVRLNGSF
ncbi:MAG: DUF2190 family protein [Bryobacteraceae bacterium]